MVHRALAVILAVVVAACGASSADPSAESSASTTPGPAGSSPAGQPSDSASGSPGTEAFCNLLTDTEIQQATGLAVASSEPLEGDGGFFAPGCTWFLADSISSLSLAVRRSGGAERFAFVYSGAESLGGLGDAAAFRGGDISGNVAAVVGDTMVDIAYALPVTTTDPKAIVVPLLEIVLGRL